MKTIEEPDDDGKRFRHFGDLLRSSL